MWEGWSKAAEATSKGLRNPITLGSSPAQVPAEWDLPKGAKHRRSGKAKTFQVITPQRQVFFLRNNLTLSQVVEVPSWSWIWPNYVSC